MPEGTPVDGGLAISEKEVEGYLTYFGGFLFHGDGSIFLDAMGWLEGDGGYQKLLPRCFLLSRKASP